MRYTATGANIEDRSGDGWSMSGDGSEIVVECNRFQNDYREKWHNMRARESKYLVYIPIEQRLVNS